MRYVLAAAVFLALVVTPQLGNAQETPSFRDCKASETAKLEANKLKVLPGERVTLTGTGWNPGTTVQIGIGGKSDNRYVSVQPDATGSFTHEFTATKKTDRMGIGAECGGLLRTLTIIVEEPTGPLAALPSGVTRASSAFPWWLLLLLLLILLALYLWWRRRRKQ